MLHAYADKSILPLQPPPPASSPRHLLPPSSAWLPSPQPPLCRPLVSPLLVWALGVQLPALVQAAASHKDVLARQRSPRGRGKKSPPLKSPRRSSLGLAELEPEALKRSAGSAGRRCLKPGFAYALSPTKHQINFSETHKVPATFRGRVMIDGSTCPQLQYVFVSHLQVNVP